jgi:hypothetical protein
MHTSAVKWAVTALTVAIAVARVLLPGSVIPGCQ